MNLTTIGQGSTLALMLFLCQSISIDAFQISTRSIRRATGTLGKSSTRAPSLRSIPSLKTTTTTLHASDDGTPAASPQQGLVAMGSDLQSQLASAFSQLDESDQYDAILTGLCAKILDDPSMKGQDVIVALQDPLNLLEEMNSRRVVAGSRSIMALVDAAAAASDAKTMAKVMSLASKNRSISQYGILQREITPLPVRRDSRVKCPDGRTRTRGERLDSLPDVPRDDRGREVTSALAVTSVLSLCWVAGVLGLDDITPLTNTLWVAIVLVGVVDNFFDLIKFGVNTFGNDKIGNVPDSLPLGLGSGQLTGTVVKGFSRLMQVDTERECECEASAFFTAYTLGLPCFSFRPNALEAAVMAAESAQKDNDLDPLLTNNGIMKILVWLMSPVAMENVKHAQLIQSDPREAEGFLNRLERSNFIDKNELWWLSEGPEEKEDMLKWAYTEADLLLRRQSTAVKDITERLASGAATVGDCVAAVENY
ncbi:hypothetical protein IV203_038088 [Nitzschia inconspicua]|uniref:Uncharacterized protein n=1 Tax=Nitzschia inconspicua TaxID=303405 RepID=A0A9K3PZH6_9STRA|nr:hypothetical protein IV203_038088 [Nitzschia inconspicua]